MSNILENLRKILSSRYGRDVRQAIHDSILDCYEDGKAGAIDITARESIDTIQGDVSELNTEVAKKLNKNNPYATGSFNMNGGSAYGLNSFCEGQNNESGGLASHAEGANSKAMRPYSHAQNLGTIADNECMTAIGKYNTENSGLAFVVGNGFSDGNRRNALELDWDGNLNLTGVVTKDGVEYVPRSEIEFQDGEEWTIGVGVTPIFAGGISSSTTTLFVTIPLPKNAKGMSVSLANDNGTCTFRYYGGYVYTPDAVSTYTIALTKMKSVSTPSFLLSDDGNYLHFVFTANPGTIWRGQSTTTNPVVNNTVVTGGFNGVTVKFTKSAAQVEE